MLIDSKLVPQNILLGSDTQASSPVDSYRPTGNSIQSGNGIKSGAFSRSISSKKNKYLALRCIQGQVIDCSDSCLAGVRQPRELSAKPIGTIKFAEVLELNRVVGAAIVGAAVGRSTVIWISGNN